MRILISIFIILTSALGQTGLDVLDLPGDARDASLGLDQGPMVNPTRILTDPMHIASLNGWSWVADIQGASMSIQTPRGVLTFQAVQTGDLELRNDIPSEAPISTFSYTVMRTGIASAKKVQKVFIGISVEYLYERSLNASASGLASNIALAYPLSSTLLIQGGIKHVGFMQALDSESTSLPSAAWVQTSWDLGQTRILTDFNSGSIPLAVGAEYTLLENFRLAGGIQVEPATSKTFFHPSLGFSLDLETFTFAYALYQLEHTLGPRHFVSLFWNF